MTRRWSRWAFQTLLALPLVAGCRGDSGSPVLDRERAGPWVRSPVFAVEVRLRGAVSVTEKPTGIYPFIKMVKVHHPGVALDIRRVGEPETRRTLGDEIIRVSLEVPKTAQAMGEAVQKLLDPSEIRWSADGHVAELLGEALPGHHQRVVVAPAATGRPSFRFHQGRAPVEALVRTAFGQGVAADSVATALEGSPLVSAFQVLETLPMGIDQQGTREVVIVAVRPAGSEETAVREQLVQRATAAQRSTPWKVRVLFRESVPAKPSAAEWWELYTAAVEDYRRELSLASP